MTSLNSINKSQESNSTSLTKSASNDSQQQTAAAASFAQQLASASSALNVNGSPSSVNNAIDTVKSIAPAIGTGFDLNSSAISSSGLDPNNFLSQSLRSGIEAQFNTLGKDIAASFIAGLAGQDSATAVTEDSAEESPAAAGELIATDSAENSEPTTAATTAEGVTPANNEKSAATADQPSLDEESPGEESQQIASAAPEASANFFSDTLMSLFESVQNLSFLPGDKITSEQEEEASSAEDQQLDSVDQEIVNTVSEEQPVG